MANFNFSEMSQQVAQEILSAMRKLDETKPGLGYLNENNWCSKIQIELLSKSQNLKLQDIKVNQSYPGYTKRYDLCIEWSDSEKAYLESKGFWPTYWKNRNNLAKHKSYLFSPIDGSPRSDKSASLDLEKFGTIRLSDSVFVGILLMGSAEKKYDMAGDFERFSNLARINSTPWNCYQSTWDNPYEFQFAYDVRLWICPYDEVANWWEKIKGNY